jgi:tRNA pseudouridine55 synthase
VTHSPPSPRWRSVDGVLLLDKPYGISSNAALQRARRLFGARKAGHTGTLDPYATGLLPVCFGEASKFARFLLESDKGYLAGIRLGANSSTGDGEGTIVDTGIAPPGAKVVADALHAFTGAQSQRAPVHSAIKVHGRPLYEYARQGVDIEAPVREVVIRELELLEFAGHTLRIRVACSKGTYIRSLATDIGERLGCGAYLAELRRTSTGGFDIRDAVDFETLDGTAPESRDAILLGCDSLVRHLPRHDLSAHESAWVRDGRTLPGHGHPAGTLLRWYDPGGAFLGVGEAGPDGLKPFRLMATGSVEAP